MSVPLDPPHAHTHTHTHARAAFTIMWGSLQQMLFRYWMEMWSQGTFLIADLCIRGGFTETDVEYCAEGMKWGTAVIWTRENTSESVFLNKRCHLLVHRSVRSDVSEESITFIFRVKSQPNKKPVCNRWLGSTDFRPWRWRWFVPPKRRFTYGLHGAKLRRWKHS
jgi:hypothetical protein